jgi:DNA polymerase type B, organellar and viral
LENAEKYGYKYEIIRGYLFDKGKPFKNYVESIYNLRIQSRKGKRKNTAINLIAKLLLNNLYGRFGIKPIISDHVITDLDNLNNYMENYSVLDVIELDNNKVLIKYNQYPDSAKFYESSQNTNLSISLPIAIFTTSYGRIEMSKFLIDPDIDVYYTDTDSIDFKGHIDPKLIGDELGIIKIEAVFSRVVYLAPKLYFTETTIDGILETENKARGLKDPNSINIELAYSLLKKDSIIAIKQEK